MDNSIKGASFTGSNDNDSIFNSGDNVYISFGKGNDTVENGGTKPYPSGGSYTVKGGDKVKIYGGADNDWLRITIGFQITTATKF